MPEEQLVKALDNIFMLLGSFIIMLIGFVAPLIGLLFSLYQEGIRKLTAEYEADRKTQEITISEKLKQKGNTTDKNIQEIEEGISQLKKMKKAATIKIQYLDKASVYKNLFSPLAFLFFFTLSSFFFGSKIKIGLLIFEIFFLIFVLNEFLKFLKVLHSIKGSSDEQERKLSEKNIGLLEALNEKYSKLDTYLKMLSDDSKTLQQSLSNFPVPENPFLEKVRVRFGDVLLNHDSKTDVDLTLNAKASYSVAIVNSEDRMAKDVEVGLIFLPDLIVENTGPDTLYKDPKTGEQIARYKVDRIHANTTQLEDPISFTPIKKGNFDVRVFIKAENIKTHNTTLVFKVR